MNIVLGVCTRSRPKMLNECLNSLNKLKIPSDATFTVIVVENDLEPLCQDIVERAQSATTDRTILYFLETSLGIPSARNRILQEGLALELDYLIFIDDDEITDPLLLIELVSTAKRFDASIVQGPVISLMPKGDKWAYLLDKYSTKKQRHEGRKLNSAATNNVLIHRSVFTNGNGQLTLKFNESMRFTGGSDTEYFKRAKALGFHIVFSANGKVYETVPIERCRLKYLTSREARTASGGVTIDCGLDEKWPSIAKHIKRGITELFNAVGYLCGIMAFAFINPERAKYYVLRVCLSASSSFGRFSALFGYRMSPYKQVEGN